MNNGRYWLETLGCPKNEVDSDKLVGQLLAEGYVAAEDPDEAELLIVNTCAFIEAAREESIDAVLTLSEHKAEGARLVVTGCMAERYGQELADALPEVDLVAGFGASLSEPTSTRVSLRVRSDSRAEPSLLDLPRPLAAGPVAYVKVAEGCDRRCGFCAIPTFRGDQRSRSAPAILAEVEQLVGSGTKEIVLIAQDLASWGLDRRAKGGDEPLEILDLGTARRASPWSSSSARWPSGPRRPAALPLSVRAHRAAHRGNRRHKGSLLRPLTPARQRGALRRMRRWGSGQRFLERIAAIRALAPEASFRSSFILGYPGETEEDHEELLSFLEAAQLDWAGFFTYSAEEGTHAADLAEQVPAELALERLREGLRAPGRHHGVAAALARRADS